MPESKVVAISHEKGGVGKTTTTVNLGIGLARQGKKVLLVDADPQGDLTKCLGIANPQELTLTLATAMNNVFSETDFDPRGVILRHQEGVDFIPANADLAAIETTLVTTIEIDRRCVLRDYLELVRDSYDYVLIDCRPSLGLTVINALAAADSVIIPVQAHTLAADDMDGLFKTVGRDGLVLNVQGQFPLYSVNNALLIAAQMPAAKQLRSFDAWKEQGVSVLKGAKGIKILEPGKEYTGKLVAHALRDTGRLRCRWFFFFSW